MADHLFIGVPHGTTIFRDKCDGAINSSLVSQEVSSAVTLSALCFFECGFIYRANQCSIFLGRLVVSEGSGADLVFVLFSVEWSRHVVWLLKSERHRRTWPE